MPGTWCRRCILRFIWLLLAGSCLLTTPVLAERYGLLVGIGDYPRSALDLQGPQYDIEALHKVLIDSWQFAPQNIQVLQDQEATKSAVLSALRDLKDRSQPGDELFFYFSGHGTSASDETIKLPLPDMTAGLVPYDARLNLAKHEIVASLIVGRSDLRPIFLDIDQSGRQLLVMIDACYSGNAVRSLSLPGEKMPTRFVQLDNSVDSLLPDSGQVQTRAIAASASEEAYPYENVFFISASGEYEEAADISGPYLQKYPTLDGKPHGAFTDAMLRVLSGSYDKADANRDKRITNLETKQGIQDWMSGKFPQTPQHLPPAEEDRHNLASRSIFGSQSIPGTIVQARPQKAEPVNPGEQSVSQATVASQQQPVNTVVAVSAPSTSPTAIIAPTAPAMAEDSFLVALDPSLTQLTPYLQQIPHLQFSNVYPNVRIVQGNGVTELRNGANDLIIGYPHGREQELIARVDQEVKIHRFIERLKQDRAFDISVDVRGKQQNGLHLGGELVSFSVQSGQDAWLVLLDIDREGGINVLFPAFGHEKRVQPASLVLETPQIEVVAPYGTDRIIALGFRENPADLFSWLGELTPRIAPQTPRFAEFFNLVSKYRNGSAIQELPFITAPTG